MYNLTMYLFLWIIIC